MAYFSFFDDGLAPFIAGHDHIFLRKLVSDFLFSFNYFILLLLSTLPLINLKLPLTVGMLALMVEHDFLDPSRSVTVHVNTLARLAHL